jgi:hypothetical protein
VYYNPFFPIGWLILIYEKICHWGELLILKIFVPQPLSTVYELFFKSCFLELLLKSNGAAYSEFETVCAIKKRLLSSFLEHGK